MSNPNVNDIVVDDGSKTYSIKNKQGEYLGEFRFRPTDTNIVSRYKEVVDFFNNFKTPSGTAEEAVREAEREVVEKIDYLIGGDSKNSFFSILGPFSLLASGELYFESVLTAIAKVIEKEFSVSAGRLQRRKNKYVEKYRK